VARWHALRRATKNFVLIEIQVARWHDKQGRHHSVIIPSFLSRAIVSSQMQRSFNAPLDGDPYGWLFNEEGDNGLSPAHFIFGDDEEDWEELEEVFLLLLFATYMEERKIKWHHE
jgi:hypothetical protein